MKLTENVPYLAALALGIILLMVYVLQGTYPTVFGSFAGVAVPALAGLATISAVLAGRRYGLLERSAFARAWLAFAFGMGAWFVGAVIQSIYVFPLDTPLPSPTIADAVYVAGYFFFLVGLIIYVRLFEVALPMRVLLLCLAAVLFMGALVFAFLFAPVVFSSGSVLSKSFDLLYPSLDLLLLFGALVGFSIFLQGKLGRSWLLLYAALVLATLADIGSSYGMIRGTYYMDGLPDLLYLWALTLFSLGFYVHKVEL